MKKMLCALGFTLFAHGQLFPATLQGRDYEPGYMPVKSLAEEAPVFTENIRGFRLKLTRGMIDKYSDTCYLEASINTYNEVRFFGWLVCFAHKHSCHAHCILEYLFRGFRFPPETKSEVISWTTSLIRQNLDAGRAWLKNHSKKQWGVLPCPDCQNKLQTNLPLSTHVEF